MSDIADIKALLLASVESLARELAPEGKRAGAYWIARNPTRADQHAGSFWIALTGAPGAWRDEATGDKGDVFGLIQYCCGLDFLGAKRWARGWLGLETLSQVEINRRVQRAETDQRAQAEQAKGDAKTYRRWAFAQFMAAKKQPFSGSPADRYLQARGIDVARLDRVPGVLGWLPAVRHIETHTTWPVMLAAFTGPDDKVVAVHRTFLAETDGRWSKAPIAPARKIWPSYAGAAIRLWRGKSGLSIGEAINCGLRETLVLTEGVEDGLCVALAVPGLRVWCAGSLANLGKIQLPSAIDDVIICADNDWGKRQAARQFDKAVAALARQQVTVSVARSPWGKDVNDALNARWGMRG